MNLFFLFLGCLWTGLVAILCVVFSFFKKSWGQKFHHLFGRGNLWLMNVKVNFIGLENIPKKGGMIFAPNHESMFDILVMASIPHDFCWLAKAEVEKILFVGRSMKAMGSYFVKRNSSSADLNVMKEVETALERGETILVFPEGTRTRTGELLPFKKGAFRTAQNAQVPLIPIAISGTWEIAKPEQLPTRGHSVIVRIGKPFYVPPEAELTEVMVNFRLELTNLLAENRRLG